MPGRCWVPFWRLLAAWDPSGVPFRSAYRAAPLRTCRSRRAARRSAAARPAARTPSTCPRARACGTPACRRARAPPSAASEPPSSGSHERPAGADSLPHIHRNVVEQTSDRHARWARSCKNTQPVGCWSQGIPRCWTTVSDVKRVRMSAGTTRSRREQAGRSAGTLANFHRYRRNHLLA